MREIFQKIPIKKALLGLLLLSVFVGVFFFANSGVVLAQEEGLSYEEAERRCLDNIYVGPSGFIDQQELNDCIAAAMGNADFCEENPESTRCQVANSNASHEDSIGSIEWIIIQILKFFMWVASWFLFLTATFFNFIIQISITLGGVDPISNVVNFGWSLFRDLANIFFIFIILYIGITTILNLNGGSNKKLLTKVVIFALLINFSLFFTRLIIDTSNILAASFYNEIIAEAKEADEEGRLEISATTKYNAGISELIVHKVGLASVYNISSQGATESEGKVAETIQQESALVYLGGIVFILVLAFVFFAGAILFTIRTIALLVIMILAPLAYVGGLLPKTAEYSKQWWDKLINYSIFAPLFTAMIFVSIKGLDGLQLTNDGTFAKAFTVADPANLAIILQYLIVIGLLVASLYVAQKLGVAGAKSVSGWGIDLKNKAQGVVGRGSVGYLADRADRGLTRTRERMEESRVGRYGLKALGAANVATLGALGGARAGVKAGAEADFGSGQSARAVREQKEKDTRAGVKSRLNQDPERAAKYVKGLSSSEQSKVMDELSARDRAELLHTMGYGVGGDMYESMVGGLSPEERDKTKKEKKKLEDIEKYKKLVGEIEELSENIDDLNETQKRELREKIRSMPDGQGRNFDPEKINDPRVLKHLTAGMLNDLLKNRDDLNAGQIESLKNTIKNNRGELSVLWDHIRQKSQRGYWGLSNQEAEGNNQGGGLVDPGGNPV